MITGFKVLLLIIYSTRQNIVFQHYYQSYCNCLLKMGHVDKEQAVFEQLILSQLKKWSSIELNAFNKYTIILTNDNDKIRIL